MNLLANAIKFTTEGVVRVSVTARRRSARRSFASRLPNTGIGMSGEVAACVFDSFVQADASTTREYGGCGLGLTICRELVQLLGGEIHAASVPARGSTFLTFTIPYEAPVGPAAHTPGARAAVGGIPPLELQAFVMPFWKTRAVGSWLPRTTRSTRSSPKPPQAAGLSRGPCSGRARGGRAERQG